MKTKKAKAKKTETFNTEYRERYKADKSVRTPSGAYSVSNGDDIAKALNGLSLEQLEKVAARAGLGERFKAWSHLNPGMRRMNLGNVFRGTVSGEDSEKAKAALAEARRMPRVEKPTPKKAAKKKVKAKRAARVETPTTAEATTLA
jgi:sRNA-binding protein